MIQPGSPDVLIRTIGNETLHRDSRCQMLGTYSRGKLLPSCSAVLTQGHLVGQCIHQDAGLDGPS